MKDEEFNKKLELILKTFYNIEREVKKYLDKEKYQTYSGNTSILCDQYDVKK